MGVGLCDEKVFSGVFESYSKTLFTYIYYKTGDSDLAWDVTQDSFLGLWKNCAKVGLNTAKGYVFQTGNNLLKNIFAKEKVRSKYLSRPFKLETRISPEFLLEEKELREALTKAIEELPEKQRVVFLMSRVDKMKYKEIAEILEISVKAVEKRMANALSSLRKVSELIK